MKISALLFGLALLATSCHTQEAAPAEDPNWVKVEVPTDWTATDAVFAIAGDIDHKLLASTKLGVYASVDHGKTWQQARGGGIEVWGLLPRHDTIFALTARRDTAQGGRYEAMHSDLDAYTVDFGSTWAYTDLLNKGPKYRQLTQPIGQLAGPSGIKYRIRGNTIRVPQGQVAIASDLLRTTTTGASQVLRLPEHRVLNNLYLDAQNRLYVAASSQEYDAKTGELLKVQKSSAAVLYVSRQPLP